MVCLRTDALEHEAPPCKTGVEITNDVPVVSEASPNPVSVNLGIHWLRGSIPHAEMKPLVEFLTEYWGSEDYAQYGLWVYDRSVTWPNGARLNYHSGSDRYKLTDGLMSLEIPGSVFAAWDMIDAAWFVKKLVNNFTFRPTRVDAFFDDLERVIVPHDLYALIYAEDYSQPFEKIGQAPFVRLVRKPIRQDWSGFQTIEYTVQARANEGCSYDCVAFGRRGKRGSGKYLRVYDKWLESAGDVPAVRWELELCDERAVKFLAYLVERPDEEWAQAIGTLITTVIDFPVRNAPMCDRKNLDRLPRHAFWENILERVGTADKNALALAVRPKTVLRSLGFVSSQAMGSMQMCRVALGRNRMLKWLASEVDKNDRLTRKHHDAIAEFLAHLDAGDDPSIGAVMDFFRYRGLAFDPDMASEAVTNEVSELRQGGESDRAAGDTL